MSGHPGEVCQRPPLSELLSRLGSADEILDNFVEAIDEALLIADASGRIVLANGAARSLFLYPERELLGRDTAMLYHRREDPPPRCGWCPEPAAECGAGTHSPAVLYRRRDGTTFHGEALGGPILDGQQRPVFHLRIIRDISARLAVDRVLNRLHQVTSDRELGLSQRVQAMLQLGVEHFGLPVGILGHIEGDQYRVIQITGLAELVPPGAVVPLAETFCTLALEADGPVGFHHAGDSELAQHPGYRRFGVEAYLGCPVTVGERHFGTLNFSGPAPVRRFGEGDLALLRLFANSLGYELERNRDWQALVKARAHLEKLATIDALTGLYNRRYMLEYLQQELARCNRYDKRLTLALLDFDHFKQLNDSLGHEAGDQALCTFARVAREALRSSDTIARWGGEEFLVALPETRCCEAETVLARLARQLAETPAVEQADGDLRITLSIGVAGYERGEELDRLVQRADSLMYRAKEEGRNRIVLDPAP